MTLKLLQERYGDGMGKIRAERLEVETQLPIITVIHVQGEVGLNMHGICNFRFQLEPNVKENEIIRAKESKIIVRELSDNGEPTGKTVFAGVIDEIRIENTGGSVFAEIKGITYSILMDRMKKKRFFQDTDMSYADLAKKIVKEYINADIVWNLDRNEKIGRPLIQYQETDWEFLMRLASHLCGGMLADESKEYLKVYAGIPENNCIGEIDDFVWEYGISSLYYEDGKWKYIIINKRISFEKGELMFCYQTGTRVLAQKNIRYNGIFKGLQLEGTVVKAEKETVCIRLDMDDTEVPATYPYPWVPNTGNLFYCMPEVGTKVYLRLLGADEREAVVIDSVRTNGETYGGYIDPKNRIFETIEEKTLKLFADELTFCGNKMGIMPELSLKDSSGATLRSQGSLLMEAGKNIILKASEFQCSTPVGIIQRAAGSNMEIHQDFNLYSPAGLNSMRVETDMKDEESVRKGRTGTYNPCWEGAYTAIGSVASFGGDIGETTSLEMISAAGIPSIGSGKAVSAMSDAVSGVPVDNIKYGEALKTIKIDTLNGGYPLPVKIKKD